MEERNNIKFGISIDKLSFNRWSFGIGLSHEFEETYLFVNFFKWSISIGFFHKIVW